MERNKNSKHPLFDHVMALNWDVIGYQNIGEDTIIGVECGDSDLILPFNTDGALYTPTDMEKFREYLSDGGYFNDAIHLSEMFELYPEWAIRYLEEFYFE